jgi:hypothetical protein
MPDYNDQIKDLEEELKNTKYNKRTQHHVGLVKAKIAKLRDKEQSRGKGGSHEGFAVKRSGNATVALLGFPSVGKSTLLNALTNQESRIGAYAFTTLTVVPGVMEHKGARIQILDLPGIIKGASAGAGRGREVISVLRQADLILIVLDPKEAKNQLNVLKKEIYDAGIRINSEKPDVKIKKDSKGGIVIYKTVKLDMDDDTIKGILREFRISNATIVIRDKVDVDQFIDCIEGNKIYTQALIAINKSDLASAEELKRAVKVSGADIAFSASTGTNVSDLKEMIFSSLRFIRIYLKEAQKKADMEIPLIVRSPCTVRDVCHKLHRDFERNFKVARVWGRSAKFPGQKVNINHSLKDKDVLEIQLN